MVPVVEVSRRLDLSLLMAILIDIFIIYVQRLFLNLEKIFQKAQPGRKPKILASSSVRSKVRPAWVKYWRVSIRKPQRMIARSGSYCFIPVNFCGQAQRRRKVKPAYMQR